MQKKTSDNLYLMGEDAPGEDYKYFSNRYIDGIEVSENYFIPVWRDVFSYVNPDTIVDIGCGSGKFSSFLVEKHNCFLIGIDGSSYGLKKAKAKGFHETFLVNDFSCDSLPLESSQYEFVVNKDVLEHLLDPMFMLREINRILKSDGMLLLHVPNHFPLSGRIRFLFNHNLDPFGFCMGAKSWENPHIRFFTYADLMEMLSINGFKIVKNLSHHFPAIPFLQKFPDNLRIKTLNYLTQRFPSQFCCGFTILAEKVSHPK